MVEVFCSVSGVFIENTYFLIDETELVGAIVDPGLGALDNLKRLSQKEIAWKSIFLTHAHFDHLMGLSEIKAFTNATIYLHKEDLFLYNSFPEEAKKFGYSVAPLPKPEILWNDGDKAYLGTTEFEVIHTPGHTPGGVCLKWSDGLMTGDTLMHLQIGRTDWFGSFEQIQHSISEKLYTLPDHLTIYPGHHQQSTIGIEKELNQEVY